MVFSWNKNKFAAGKYFVIKLSVSERYNLIGHTVYDIDRPGILGSSFVYRQSYCRLNISASQF